MNKSPEAFRTISEVADTLDVPPHVLRFWETRFNQVKPVKRGGGRRYYRPEDVCLLRGIKGLLYDEGMTIKGAQKILRERGVRHVIGLGTLPDGDEAAPAATPPKTAKPSTARRAKDSAAKPAPPEAPRADPPEAPGPPTPRATPPRAPQADFFEPDVATVPNVAATTVRPIDKTALRALVRQLQELRAAMMADQSQ